MAKTSLIFKQLYGNKEMQGIVTLSGSIAHELKNYLAAINICAELSEDKLKSIRKQVSDASYVINNLQMQIKCLVAGKLSTDDFKQYSVVKNIEEVLGQYPFRTDRERALIRIENTKDFVYVGNPILTNHILYNLIRNSLHAIKNADRGIITIRFEPGIKFNKLIFRDTAAGISKQFLPKIFKLFETKGGTGIGLAFCKMVMKSYGGNIECDSVERKYTEFTLKFPRILTG